MLCKTKQSSCERLNDYAERSKIRLWQDNKTLFRKVAVEGKGMPNAEFPHQQKANPVHQAYLPTTGPQQGGQGPLMQGKAYWL